jgi:hypothetical protein
MVYVRGEHPPPHVHVIRAGSAIPVMITLAGAVWRGDWSGRKPNQRERDRAVAIVLGRLQDCLFAWNRYHAATTLDND